ncbi:hypothetical protein [Sinomonas susongensis]|uniref:hypothetical protein n=1 Tax=Sinomonas susongensis TaxID=1324851 RepID=UPI00110905F1|nr:hypothetical protein [Sinomonas susongensis]
MRQQLDPKGEMRRALAGDRKVIVDGRNAELHCYLVAAGVQSARVVWTTASGRRRQRIVQLAQVRLPDPATPWEGVEISPDRIPFASPARL